jgi:hypothetical protein
LDNKKPRFNHRGFFASVCRTSLDHFYESSRILNVSV